MKDGSGKIDAKELANFLGGEEFGVPQKEIEKLIMQADTDGDGEV